MFVDRPSESDLNNARDTFWDDVARGLATGSTSPKSVDAVIGQFRKDLSTKQAEEWAYHDGVDAVVRKLSDHLKATY